VDDLPQPLVDASVELKDFPFTPLYRARLFGSEFHSHASDSEWRAGVTLWLKSWDQSPAGSLPNNEVALCRLAELGKDLKAWRKLSAGALHGWVLCSDGRLYHPVVAEGINDAWQRKQAQRDRTKAARAAINARRPTPPPNGHDTDPVTEHSTERVTETVAPSVTDNVTGSKRQGQRYRQGRKGTGSEELRSLPLRIPTLPSLKNLLPDPASPHARARDAPNQAIPPPNEESEGFKKLEVVNPVAHFARSAPSGASATADEKRELLRQKLGRFVKATFAEPQLTANMIGLCGGDPDHNERWWLNRLDKLMRLQNWDDTSEWRAHHLEQAA
jgi:hypothetical protein